MELYCMLNCMPSRAVLLTAAHLGLDLKLNIIDTFKGEQFDPEYAELNPDKKIPFLVDGDFKLGESRAIMIYLVEKYGRNSRLLPGDPASRALVNRALHFDIGLLSASMYQYYFLVVFKTDEEDPEDAPQRYDRLKEVVGILDGILENQDYVAGRNLTIADLSIIVTIVGLQGFGFELDDYKNVLAWMERVSSSVPNYEDVNSLEGMQELRKMSMGEDDSEEEEEEQQQQEEAEQEPSEQQEQEQEQQQQEEAEAEAEAEEGEGEDKQKEDGEEKTEE